MAIDKESADETMAVEEPADASVAPNKSKRKAKKKQAKAKTNAAAGVGEPVQAHFDDVVAHEYIMNKGGRRVAFSLTYSDAWRGCSSWNDPHRAQANWKNEHPRLTRSANFGLSFPTVEAIKATYGLEAIRAVHIFASLSDMTRPVTLDGVDQSMAPRANFRGVRGGPRHNAAAASTSSNTAGPSVISVAAAAAAAVQPSTDVAPASSSSAAAAVQPSTDVAAALSSSAAATASVLPLSGAPPASANTNVALASSSFTAAAPRRPSTNVAPVPPASAAAARRPSTNVPPASSSSAAAAPRRPSTNVAPAFSFTAATTASVLPLSGAPPALTPPSLPAVRRPARGVARPAQYPPDGPLKEVLPPACTRKHQRVVSPKAEAEADPFPLLPQPPSLAAIGSVGGFAAPKARAKRRHYYDEDNDDYVCSQQVDDDD
ncbi:hypothetical protein H9P43_006272 [Blastocladiella emersonii ATCC 22665]|nr:hypothetical protein H9P43_006272 [Blastocladiella emersonii ATCC 22665]